VPERYLISVFCAKREKEKKRKRKNRSVFALLNIAARDE
jgi:hypothetical protein